MASCIGAQHAHVRLDRADRDVDQLFRLLDLLAAESSVPTSSGSAARRQSARRPRLPRHLAECEAVGIDPDTGEAA